MKLIKLGFINSLPSQTLHTRVNCTGQTERLFSTSRDKDSVQEILECVLDYEYPSVQLGQGTAKQFIRPECFCESVSLEEELTLLDSKAEPSFEIIISILQKCKREKNAFFAMLILVHIHSFGLEDHKVVGNFIVPMLVECGSIVYALSTFHKLLFQNEYTWTSLIQGYIDSGNLQFALDIFQKMQCSSIVPSIYTLQSIVKACARLKSIETGREMHTIIVREEYEKDLIVGNTLVDLYAKCGFFEEAQSVLTELPTRDAISWNALIAGYVEHGFGEEALDCLAQMKFDGASPDEVTFLSVLKGCGFVGTHKVQELHTEIIREGFERYPFVGNSLVGLYGKGGLLGEALEVFNELLAPDVVSWNALITGYTEHGFGEEAFLCLDSMRMMGVCPDDLTYMCSLKACGSLGMIGQSQQVHSQIVKQGYESFSGIGNTLVDIYARNRFFLDAWKVFQGLPVKSVVSWTSLILGCAENGLGEEGLTCWEQMCSDGVSPNNVAFVCSLKNCGIIGALEKGLAIHKDIAEGGLEGDSFICSALVDMYAKCGSFAEAEEVFMETPVRDIVLWTALIAGYADYGFGEAALKLLDQMLLESISPNLATFLCSLKACGSLQGADRGRQVHAMIIKTGFENEHVLNNTLVDTYSKCGLLDEARFLFDKISDYSTASWNVLISGYADQGLGEEVFNCFEEMRVKGISANDITLISTLKGCSSLVSTDRIRLTHTEMVKLGYEKDYFASNTLINLYSKRGLMSEACKLFSGVSVRDVGSWNAFMLGYAECALEEEVLNQSEQLQGYPIAPNAVTFLCTLKACANLAAKDKGQATHIEIVKRAFDSYPYIGSSLVDLYSKCGLIAEAKRVFDNLPVKSVNVWTALMAGYAEQGLFNESSKCFNEMKLEGLSPTSVTFLCSLKGWGIKGDSDGGRKIHSEIIKYGTEKDPLIGTTLVDMYGKCGLVLDAQTVFDKLSDRLAVSWTSLIAAYVERGFFEKALCWFKRMHLDGVCPDAVTYLCCLKACSNLGVVDNGQTIHAEVVQMGLDADILLCGALIDFYAKCGLLMEAWEGFNNWPIQNSVSWTALIVGFASQGENDSVFTLLERMWDAGIPPDEVILLSVLTVCSHVGLVDIGLCYLKFVSEDYDVNATIEHHNCFLDLLGRAGQVEKASAWAECMPLQPNFITWKTVLGACTKYGMLEFGGEAFKNAVQLDEQQAAPFVLMSNMAASFH